MDFAEIFTNAIKRDPGHLLDPLHPGPILNLGSGRAPIDGAINLDRPEWEAPFLFDIKDESVSVVHAYHFIEHLSPSDAHEMLREIERVLMPGSVANIAVPHAMCPLAFQAPDHRSYWTEEGWQDTFYSTGYDSGYGHKWDLDITWMMVASTRWQNLCVLLQLAKRVRGLRYPTPWSRS
jgi:ribosome modulation factor